MKYFYGTLPPASNLSPFPLSLSLWHFTFSRRTDGRKAAWHSFLMVQFSGRGASSWFMVPTLHCGATGAWWLFPAPGSMLPHSGGKNGRGSPTPSAKKHASPRAWPSTENHQLQPPPRRSLYFPKKLKLSPGQLFAPSPSSPCFPLQTQRVQDKPNQKHHKHLNPLLPVAGVYSAMAQKSQERIVFSQTKEWSAALHNRYMSD